MFTKKEMIYKLRLKYLLRRTWPLQCQEKREWILNLDVYVDTSGDVPDKEHKTSSDSRQVGLYGISFRNKLGCSLMYVQEDESSGHWFSLDIQSQSQYTFQQVGRLTSAKG